MALVGLRTRVQVKVCAVFRPGIAQTTTAYTKRVLRHLARRYQTLDTEIKRLFENAWGVMGERGGGNPPVVLGGPP